MKFTLLLEATQVAAHEGITSKPFTWQDSIVVDLPDETPEISQTFSNLAIDKLPDMTDRLARAVTAASVRYIKLELDRNEHQLELDLGDTAAKLPGVPKPTP